MEPRSSNNNHINIDTEGKGGGDGCFVTSHATGAEACFGKGSGRVRLTTTSSRAWRASMAVLLSSGSQRKPPRLTPCDTYPGNSVSTSTHNAGDGRDQRAKLGTHRQDPGAHVTGRP